MTPPPTDANVGTVPAPTIAGSRRVILPTLMLATLLANVASVCLFPHMVTLSEEFGQPVNNVVWTIAAFHVIAVGLGGVAAALGAVFGNKRMLLITLGLLLVGCLAAALSTSLSMLIAARVLQGVGIAVQALSVGVIAHYYKGGEMRRAISMIVLAIGVGAVIAYLAGGFIWRSGGSWRTIFWVLTGATALDLALTASFLKETKRVKSAGIDFVGCAGLVAWTLLLLIPLSQANSWGWGSAKVLGMMLPGVVVVVLWAVWELRIASPLIDLRILKRSGVWQSAVVWVVLSTTLIAPATVLPYLFQTPKTSGFGFGTDIFVVSLALAVTAVTMIGFSASAAAVMRKLGPKGTMLLGAAFGLVGFGFAFGHGSMWLVFVWLAASGAVPGWAGSAGYSLAAEAVSPEQGVIAGTICNTAGAIGAAVSAAAVGYVLTLRQVAVEMPGPAGPVTQYFPAESTFTWSMLIVGVLALVSMASVLTVRSAHLGRERDPTEYGPVALESET